MAILTLKHYQDNAKAFVDRLKSNNAYYVTVSNPDPWTNSLGQIDDTMVPTANNTINNIEQNIYQKLIYGKKIKSSDVSLMIPRINWTSGTVYSNYDQTVTDLELTNYFVMTDEYNVFKCIDNNNNSLSTVKPRILATVGNSITGDGYIWKYMYSVDTSANSKFTTTTYIPLTLNANVIAGAIPGSIDTIKITNPGQNYSIYEEGFISSYDTKYSVKLPTTSASFDNYYVGSSIYIKTGYGSAQLRTITSYDSVNKLVSVATPFDTFIHLDLANISGNSNFVVGNLVTQAVDKVDVLYTRGSFNVGDTITQSDTGSSGTIVSANSTNIQFERVTANTVSVNSSSSLPFTSSAQSPVLKSGTVSVVSNTLTQIIYTSNTLPFSNNETVYQANSTANVSVSTIFSINAAASSIYVKTTSGTINTSNLLIGVTSNTNANVTSFSTYDIGNSYVYSTANTNFIVDYIPNDYITISGSTRRVNFVNSSLIIASSPFSTSLSNAIHYNSNNSTTPTSYTQLNANGYISSVNINTAVLSIANNALSTTNYILGETVDMTTANGQVQAVNATVSFSNTSSVILSNIQGTGFILGYKISGESSGQSSYITNINTNPNITIPNPSGTFINGKKIYVKNPTTLSVLANASIVSSYYIPNQLSEYVIGPSVTVTGDGVGAKGYARVNTSTNTISSVIIVNGGNNYTYANVTITSNSLYGNSANAFAVISPILGHGSDPARELGAKYVAIDSVFDTSINENFIFPSYGSYRRINILENPKFNNVTVNLNNFDRAQLYLANASSYFSNNEIVIQPSSNAAGIVVYSTTANNTYLELKTVTGTFIANGAFANSLAANDTIVGLKSNTTAHVTAAIVPTFVVGNNISVFTEKSQSTGVLVSNYSSNSFNLTSVDGTLTNGDRIYSPTTNAYANIISIFTSNNTIDSSSTFGFRFNQTTRISLDSYSGTFQKYESVKQQTTNATGNVLSATDELDLLLDTTTKKYNVGDVIQSTSTLATATVVFSNTTYLKLISVSTKINSGETIINISANTIQANVVTSIPVIRLYNTSLMPFAINNTIVGANSGATAYCAYQDKIQYPDLVKNSGSVIYTENFTPFTSNNTSREDVKVIIKF